MNAGLAATACVSRILISAAAHPVADATASAKTVLKSVGSGPLTTMRPCFTPVAASSAAGVILASSSFIFSSIFSSVAFTSAEATVVVAFAATSAWLGAEEKIEEKMKELEAPLLDGRNR